MCGIKRDDIYSASLVPPCIHMRSCVHYLSVATLVLEGNLKFNPTVLARLIIKRNFGCPANQKERPQLWMKSAIDAVRSVSAFGFGPPWIFNWNKVLPLLDIIFLEAGVVNALVHKERLEIRCFQDFASWFPSCLIATASFVFCNEFWIFSSFFFLLSKSFFQVTPDILPLKLHQSWLGMELYHISFALSSVEGPLLCSTKQNPSCTTHSAIISHHLWLWTEWHVYNQISRMPLLLYLLDFLMIQHLSHPSICHHP